MKRLVFCFDGSWNRLDAPFSTNVVITAESVLPIALDGTAQVIFYDEGVGTRKGEKLSGGMFGHGIVENLGDAYRFLIFNHTPGDEIYIFGFSRGAYTARSFAGLLSTCGILRRSNAARVTDAILLYQQRNAQDRTFVDEMMVFRCDNSPHVCVSDEEDRWRCENVPGYTLGSAPRLRVTYLGVWDTVGALGVPTRYKLLNFLDRKYEFHDTSLSPLVKSGRHAVAIDERRKDFVPTLWDNVAAMNMAAGFPVAAVDAPYQQKWFPGVHGSVGGGGERRGLSDRALDWILDGARHQGLELDAADHSRIFELAPDYKDYLANSPPPEKPGLIDRMMSLMPHADRLPGPRELYEVSVSAQQRWLESPPNLRDNAKYRPPTLANVAPSLNALDPTDLGVGVPPSVADPFTLYLVKRGDTLSGIALSLYQDSEQWRTIFAANRGKLEDPNRIYVGQSLRVPLTPRLVELPR
jgi:uncharacterized protein (DUF2235 family)